MINIAAKTEFSFRQCFAPMAEIVKEDYLAMGIADVNNTLGHVPFQKECKRKNVKPIFGVRLTVCDKLEKAKSARQSYVDKVEVILLAKDEDGLREIYELTSYAWDNFYYFPRVDSCRFLRLSKAVIVIAPYLPISLQSLSGRIDFRGVSVDSCEPSNLSDKQTVAIQCNLYPNVEDKPVYQLLAGARKAGTGYNYMFNDASYPQHLLSDSELIAEGISVTDIVKSAYIAEICNAKLPKAEIVKYKGGDNIFQACVRGAEEKGIDLDNPEYSTRLKREIDLIKEKDFGDYFLIVADMITYAKLTMLVGPSRGSSAGSLVCYLMGITEIDPIEHGLLFERFIDINRLDLPDIDIDFPDKKREKVVKYLSHKYGHKNVRCLSNINRLKPKSAIDDFAMGLGIPKIDKEELKNAIIERSSGDARASMCINDTFESTDVGRAFIEQYPAMRLVGRIENHAAHSGKHAAGILVSTEELTKYASINNKDNVVMLDKKDAEYLNLLKIDCLGLRTLTILEETMDAVNMEYKSLYSLPLDDQATYDIFNTERYNGIFQFEGQALQFLAKQMGVYKFDDIAAITALARPGPMHSGGANSFVKRRTGESVVEYITDDPIYIKHTEETLGIIIYQEQLMFIAKELGDLSWEDVSDLRKAASKSLGEEYFNKYKEKFLEGTAKRGLTKDKSVNVWENMVTFGSWGFNKSHAVSYALISYWTAYMKAHYPLEFAIANLNNARDDDSAIKLLRDFVTNEGYEYVAVDPDTSEINWSVQDGILVGGLINIKGIGDKKAMDIIKRRVGKKGYTPGQLKTLMNPVTPTEHFWGKFYNDPTTYGLSEAPTLIKNISEPMTYTIIGKLIMRDLRDLNDYNEVVKRGGQIYEDQNLYLRLLIEDDTDQILCVINRYMFEELGGQYIAETSVIGETWFMIKGRKRGDWRKIDIDYILNLSEWEKQ
jgi:DNA polymerase III alpha subunit